MTKSRHQHGTDSPRIKPARGTTSRDIHISESGVSEAPPPSKPGEQTRIAVWRPIATRINIKPDPEPTPQQEEILRELREYTESELVLTPADEEYEEYAEWERRFLDAPDTYPRYARASQWKLPEAKRRIRETLLWRREYRPDLIKPSEIAHEAEGGKVVVNGFDTCGRPIVWLRPSRENTKPSPRQIRHLIFQLERAIDLMPEGVTKLALVVDYHGATASSNPSKDTAMQVIQILQNHYCERLGRAVVINVPWYLDAFFKVLKPMLDPNTSSKVKFNPEMSSMVPLQQLDAEFGGQHDYYYDSKVYLPALCHYCGIKEDGTREDVIPCRQRDAKPEEIQRALTMQQDELAEMSRQVRNEGNLDSPAPNGADPAMAENATSTGPDTPPTAPAQSTTTNSKSTEGAPHTASYVAIGAATAGATGVAVAGHRGGAGADKGEKELERHGAHAAQPVAHTAQPVAKGVPGRTRSRGGWQLFSSKRGLDKEGNPAVHKHKHLIRSLCMHKGAINPGDKRVAPTSTRTTSESHARSDTTAVDSLPAEPGKNKIKIADSANASKDRAPHGVNPNVPLGTNATFGPEDYQTALEGPEASGVTDYFSGVGELKHRAIPVNHVRSDTSDEAHIVRRDTELMQRLKTDDSEQLTLAFQVKQPPRGEAELQAGAQGSLGAGKEANALTGATAVKETVLTAPHDPDANL